jgi:ribosome-interacting GTPase 1
METLVEKKQKLFEVIDGYTALLDGWGNKKLKEDLWVERKHIEDGRYQMALIGYVKRGKSTLLNALLGSADNYRLAPVKTDTCTAAVVKYLDSALYPDCPGKEGAIIEYNTGAAPGPAHINLLFLMG